MNIRDAGIWLPRGRNMWLTLIGVAVLGGALLSGLAMVGALPWTPAALLAGMWLLCVGTVGMGVLARRAAIQSRNLNVALYHHARESLDAIDRGRAEIWGQVAVLAARVEDTRSELDELRQSGLCQLGTDIVRRVEESQTQRFAALSEQVSRQGRDDYEQHVAWQELREALHPGPFMPALRGWAASPDVLRLVIKAIYARPPKLVVECGSGASSVWLGYALRRAGGGRLVALEHDERYADLTRRMVGEHDLLDMVEIRYAPLRDWVPADSSNAPNPKGQPWYDPYAVDDLEDIDLMFVDGPPHFTAPEARYPAGPVLLPRCSTGAVVVLDDTSRPDERAVSSRWLAADPGLGCDEVPAEKGAHVFTWRTRAE